MGSSREVRASDCQCQYPKMSWAWICKRLRGPVIDSKKSIPPAFEALRAGTITLFVLPAT